MNKLLPALITGVFLFTFLPHKQLLATKHIVEVKDFEFDPVDLQGVQIGDTIRWEWVSGFHTTTSAAIPDGAASWDSPITPTITSFEYVVQVPGTYNYVCTPHVPGMVATFTVLPASTLAVEPDNRDVSAEAGSTTFSVSSNAAWTAESDSDWCVTASAGDGDGTIEVDYEANTGSETRIATITVSLSEDDYVEVTVTQESSVSISEVNIADLRIYPNPSRGMITLKLEQIKGKKAQISVLNLEGRLVAEESITATSLHSLNLSHLANGSYIILLETETERYSKQVLLSGKQE
jgi:plastocyanin